jgi:hypothetical protein
MPRITDPLDAFLPSELRELGDLQKAMPRIAKNRKLTGLIESAIRDIPTRHDLRLGDARSIRLEPESVHLVLTSPPYWTLKKYRDHEGQLGHVDDYADFLKELGKVWKQCFRALVPAAIASRSP